MNNSASSAVVRKHKPRGSIVRDLVKRLNTPTGIIVDKYLVKVFEEQGFEFDPQTDNRSVYDKDQLFVALNEYSRKSTNYDSKILEQAIAITFKEFGGDGNLRAHPLTEGLKSFIKLEKSSGLPLVDTKGASFELDLMLAKEILDTGKPFPPCIAYHRTQFGEKGPKTRLVWGYPQSATLVEAMFARPLIQHYLHSKTAMTIGYRKMELSAITQRVRNCGLTYCLDFSKFDSSIGVRFLGAAFDIMKSHFTMDEDDEIAWNRIYNYFVHTTILMPDGYVYQKHGGVPSGSYFTQLVDSIVNFLATQYIALRLTEEAIPSGWLFVLGDDSIFTLNEYVPLSEISRVGKELGLTINSDKSVVAKDSEQVHYLGHYWPNGVASRPLAELQKRLVTSETPSRNALPTQRGDKLFAFIGDAKEGLTLYHQVLQARNRRLRHKEYLLLSVNPKGFGWLESTGHMRSLRAVDISVPSSDKFMRTGLWLS